MTPTYNLITTNVKQSFTLFNEFGHKYKDIVWKLNDLSKNEKKLLIHIAFREYKNGLCSELQRSIANILNVTVRTVRSLVKKLIKKGYIKTIVPDLVERRSLSKKIIYKILPERFIKKPKENQAFSPEISPERTYILNKEFKNKTSQGGSFFSEKFLFKKQRAGYSPEEIEKAVNDVESTKKPKSKYALFSFFLKNNRTKTIIEKQNDREKEEIRKHRERVGHENGLYSAQVQREPYYDHGKHVKPDIQPVSLADCIGGVIDKFKRKGL